MVRAKVLRQEKKSTAVGVFDTLVLKPEFEIGGVFTPTGDNFIWVTNDDRKMIVRIESKIKIGTLVVGVQNIKK